MHGRRTVLSMVMVLSLGGCQPEPSGRPPVAGSEGATAMRAAGPDLLFTRRGDRASDLYLRRADGTLVDLTGDTEGDNWGVWSPDGSGIAFQARRDGNTELYVMDADGGNPRNLSNDPAHDGLPVWSPDGERIAFFSSRGLSRNERGLPGHIYLIGVDGRGLTRLTRTPLESTLGPSAWSPDGRHLLFTRLGDAGGSRVVRLDVETGREESLYESDAVLGGATFSPDGERIAAYADDGSSARIVLLRPDDGVYRLEPLGPEGGRRYYPRWSPDGDRILVTTQTAENGYDIESIDLAGGTVEKVLDAPDSDLEASWRPGPRHGERSRSTG